MSFIQDLKKHTHRLIKPELIIPTNGGLVKPPDFSVVLGICTHRDVKLQVFNTLRAMEQCPNPKVTVATAIGDALIDRSRSILATTFLLDRKEDILWFIDDDIVISTMDLSRLMWQMHKMDLDILAAAYPIKTLKNGTFAVRTLDDKTNFVVGKGGEIQPMRYVSTGCMGIKRKVFEKMRSANIVHLCHPKTKRFYPFFTPMEYQINGEWIYLSEDWAFCQRALDLGFKIWCDFSVKLGHIGPYEYTWNDFFNERKDLEGFNYNVNIAYE